LPVAASVDGSSPPHKRLFDLAEAGVYVQLRRYQLWKRGWRKIFAARKTPFEMEITRFLAARPPAIILVSGDAFDFPLGLLEKWVESDIPFATICQANAEHFWPDDEAASRYRKVMTEARRCYFVSNANQRLFEKQIGCELTNAEIVFNPFNVDINATLPCLRFDDDRELRLASVARLHPPSKGQDILLEALADPIWRTRRWCLGLYGEGPMKNSIERMVERLGLRDRVRFAGFVSPVGNIWIENHVLVMPSRYEGMPLAMVEAMMCARPVVATDVAGHSEIVKDGVNGFLAEAPTASSVGRALERLWARRLDLEAIGKVAAQSIRQHVPADPASIFSGKIKALANIP
jgi:glycosyltransferase involved in cell wall biosynthesis